MDNVLYEYQDAIETLLQYIDYLEFQIQSLEQVHNYDIKMIDEAKGEAVKQWKIIDEMAEMICRLDVVNNYKLFNKDIKKVKQYFEKKVEEK